jgi:penicillin amidase
VTPDTIFRILSDSDGGLFGDRPIARRDELLGNALQSARQRLAKLLGPDQKQWSWGRLHTIQFRHALDLRPGAKTLLDPDPVSRPGDEHTVNATGYEGDSWNQVSGASYREILDAADWDRSVAVNTPGQSGQPESPHYADLLPLWDAGQYFPLLYSRQAVESQTLDRLTLEP